MTIRLNRRRLIGGSLAAGAALATGVPTAARADGIVYDEPAAFDLAEQAFFSQGFTTNEDGGFAWGASYYLLGLVRMYEAYGDVGYLDRLRDYATTVLLPSTDAERGVTDYLGRSSDVWRASGNYTAAHGDVLTADGQPAVRIRWAGTRGAETQADITEVAGDRFSIRIANPNVATFTLTDASLDPTDSRYLVTLVNARYGQNTRWTATDLRTAPAAAPVTNQAHLAFAPQHYVFAVHTGMIIYPLAKYARIVLESATLSRTGHRGLATRILQLIKRAVAFHADEFVSRNDGTGDYVFPYGAPIPFDGTIQPYNQSHAMGQALTELHRITGDEAYGQQVNALLTTFQRGLTTTAESAYQWPYWPVHSQVYQGYSAASGTSSYTPSVGASRQWEDMSHAAISVEFVHAAADNGFTAAQALLPHFAATYTANLIATDTTIWFQVNGSGAAGTNAPQCARWCRYAEQDELIYHHDLRVYQASAVVPDQGSHALGVAYLNWSRQEGWR